jgi:hypothetical protein
MENGNNDKVQKLAQSAWFAVLGRCFMILCVPLLSFVLVNIVDLKTDMKVLQVTLDAQKAAIIESSTNFYRSSEAVRDQKLMQLLNDELKRRIEVLEGQLKPADSRRR